MQIISFHNFFYHKSGYMLEQLHLKNFHSNFLEEFHVVLLPYTGNQFDYLYYYSLQQILHTVYKILFQQNQFPGLCHIVQLIFYVYKHLLNHLWSDSNKLVQNGRQTKNHLFVLMLQLPVIYQYIMSIVQSYITQYLVGI